MRAEIIHVTDHAAMRWEQRILKEGTTNVKDIVSAIKESKIVKKNELLPFNLPRHDGSVYAYHLGFEAIFVLDPVNIDEYRLVTVISSTTMQRGVPKIVLPIGKPHSKERMSKIMKEISSCENNSEQRNSLLAEKQKIEKRLADLPKSSSRRAYFVGLLSNIEQKLNNTKIDLKQKNQEAIKPVKENSLFGEILHELRIHNQIQQQILSTLQNLENLKLSIEVKK